MKLREEDLSSANGIRLHVFLARCGIASRRACEELILQGRVGVNGKIITQLGYKNLEQDIVTLDGKRITPVKKKIYIALHKPVGYLCAGSDRWGRPLAEDLFKDKIALRLFHVGRLDYLSSGLIFFTNDGIFAKIVSHPRYNIEKEYLVHSKNPIADEVLEKYICGVKVEGRRYKAKQYKRISETKVKIILVAGKNREIRKVLQAYKITIRSLQRVRIGMATLDNLKVGEFRHLTSEEVNWFFAKDREGLSPK
jgi:23S rRNA pseudouridine2605 synthase